MYMEKLMPIANIPQITLDTKKKKKTKLQAVEEL